MRWKNLKGTKMITSSSKRGMVVSLSNYITNPAVFSLRQNHSFVKNQTKDCSSAPLSLSADVFHATAIKSGAAQSSSAGNYILNMYAKGHQLPNACKLFDELPERDVRSWTILISGFAKLGCYGRGIDYFSWMMSEGIVMPNAYTFASVLKCCGGVTKGLQVGKAVHGWIVGSGIDLDVALENALLDLYVKCGALDYAERLFQRMDEKNKDPVSWNIMLAAKLRMGDMEKCLDFFRSMSSKEVSSWNTIIDGCLQQGFELVALELLYDMVRCGNILNKFSFSISLALLSSLRCLELGKQVHGRLLRGGNGISDDPFVKASLVDMYCKCGQMEKANIIFTMMPLETRELHHSMISVDDIVAQRISWSALIAGYVDNGMVKEALESFRSMIREEFEINMVTLTSIVTACANGGLLELGQQVHARIQKFGYKPDASFISSMVDMYAKGGRLEDARSFFAETKTQNVVSWTAMISSYAMHGCGEEAVQIFELMQNEGVTPNEVTFIGVLTACSHAGLIREGHHYFTMMRRVFGIKPGVEHFTCMVDLYGRAGQLDEIKNFIFENDISRVVPAWTAFLSYCQLHKHVKMAKWVFEKLLELEPCAAAPYVLLTKTYLDDHNWEEASRLRNLMQDKKIEKLPGQSWI